MNLTARGTALVAGIALLGILGQWIDALGSVAWWRLGVALIALGLAYEWIKTRSVGLSGRLKGHERLYLGRAERVDVEFRSASGRPWRVQFAPAAPAALAAPVDTRTVHLPPRGASAERLDVRPQQIGEHGWGPIPSRVEGPLRLAWWTRRLVPEVSFAVVPDTLGPRHARVGIVAGGSSAQTQAGGAREFHHLREYRVGDPRHTIDWKAVARTGQLVTRVFGEDQHLEVVVMLDVGRTSRTQIDGMSQLGHYVNLTSRFAEYCVSSDDQVGLVAFADDVIATVKPGRGLAAVRSVRKVLSGLATRPVESDVLSAALRVRRMVNHRCLVVILTDLYERSATSQLVQTTRLLVPKHLPFAVGLIGEETLGLGSRRAAHWLDPYRSFAARDFERSIDGNAARLTRLGAHALTARPAELDSRVLNQYARLRAQRRI